jgi:hypothetical protein
MNLKSANIPTWILEHLTAGSNQEALSGDLLEEFHQGRSITWYWRQVLTAVGTRAWIVSREYILIAVFSAVWSTLFPFWRALEFSFLPPHQPVLLWPYSTLTVLADGLLPAISFVWLGLLIYLLARSKIVDSHSKLQILRSLSTSISVLLITVIGTLFYLKNPIIDVRYVMHEDFFSFFHLFAISISLAAPLAVAIFLALPPTPRTLRGQSPPSFARQTPADREGGDEHL